MARSLADRTFQLRSLAEPGAPAPRLLDLVPDGAASRDDVLEEPDRTVSFYDGSNSELDRIFIELSNSSQLVS